MIGVFRERVSTFGASEVQRAIGAGAAAAFKSFTGTEYIRVLYAAGGPRRAEHAK